MVGHLPIVGGEPHNVHPYGNTPWKEHAMDRFCVSIYLFSSSLSISHWTMIVLLWATWLTSMTRHFVLMMIFWHRIQSCSTGSLRSPLRDFWDNWSANGLDHEVDNLRLERLGWPPASRSETLWIWPVYSLIKMVQELDKWQLKHRVSTMPSLLEFLGYV